MARPPNDDNGDNGVDTFENSIEKAKKEGPVPLLHPDNCTKGWAIPPNDKFFIRGADYLSSKIKVPSQDYLLKPLGFDWIRSPSKITHILSQEQSRVNATRLSDGFIWAFNLQLPVHNFSLISYFVSYDKEHLPGSLVHRFIHGDEEFKKSRLKMIADIVDGPWIVKAAIGKQVVSILGRATNCKFFVGKNYVEVDVDVGGSMVGRALVRLAFGYVQKLTVDLAFLIEGQSTEELPETVLGAVRFSQLDPESSGFLDGHGFSHSHNGTVAPVVPGTEDGAE